MPKKSHFRGCLDKLYGKGARTPLKPASQHLYTIH